MILGEIPPPPGWNEPRFAVEFDGDEMVVHVAYRAGLTDEEIGRRARKEAGVLAPVRVTLDDAPRWIKPIPEEAWDIEHQLQPGVRAVFYGNTTVWTIVEQQPCTDDEITQWRSKGEAYEEYIASGGRLVHVDLVDADDGEADITLPTGYQRDRSKTMVWIIPPTDHWPVCSGCGSVWPCRDHNREMMERHQDEHERSQCHRCRKTDGDQHVFSRGDGFPERRSYHLRLGACLNEAVRYANEHGWLLEQRHGWRRFVKAPDDMERPIVQKIEYPKRHGAQASQVVHMDHVSDDDRTVPLCGATVNVPKLTGTWGDVTCKRCLALQAP